MKGEKDLVIYLDNAATAPVKEKIADTIYEYLRKDNGLWFNPSSQYYEGRRIRKIVEDARCTIKMSLNAHQEDRFIFTSSGSESNNLAIKGFLCANKDYILITDKFAHSSVRKIEHGGLVIGNNSKGIIMKSSLISQIDYASRVFHKKPFVCIVGANNEIGTIQDIMGIAKIVHDNEGILFVDGVQLFADSSIDVDRMGIDMLSISGHKIGCPSGIAGLYVKNGISIKAIINGSQEDEIRGGTENVPYIVAFAQACEDQYFCNNYDDFDRDVEEDAGLSDVSSMLFKKALRDHLVKRILAEIDDTYLVGTDIDGKFDDKHYRRLTNHASICFREMDAKNIISYLDNHDIMVSGGSACNSMKYEPSEVLRAIGLDDCDIHCVVRFTVGECNCLKEIDETVEVLKDFKRMSMGGASV